MKYFKTWNQVLPRAFTADGTANGLATVTSTIGFYINQTVVVSGNMLPDKQLQVKKILGLTQMLLGPVDYKAGRYCSISYYTVAVGSSIQASEQEYDIDAPDADILPAVYENQPVSALRVLPVDAGGNSFDASNPFPVTFDGTVSVGDVSIVEGGNTMTVNPNGTTNVQVEGPNGNFLEPNSDGSLKTVALFTKPYDSITANYPLATQEVYQSRVGGIAGTIQQTATVNYTDASKNYILNVAVV